MDTTGSMIYPLIRLRELLPYQWQPSPKMITACSSNLVEAQYASSSNLFMSESNRAFVAACHILSFLAASPGKLVGGEIFIFNQKLICCYSFFKK